jgi:sarcosine oxidase subunit alpha
VAHPDAKVLAAQGAIERPLSFAGNDIPGVMLASAVRDYVVNWAVSPGDRTVVVTNNDDAYRTAIALKEAGLEVPAIIDARGAGDGRPARPRPRPGHPGRGRARHRQGQGRQARDRRCHRPAGRRGRRSGRDRLRCVAMSGGWSPVVHMWSHCGGKLTGTASTHMFRPDAARPPITHDGSAMVIPAGAANGALTAAEALADAAEAAGGRSRRLG